MKTFWIDMDGVLAQYHRKDYKCADPLFLHLGEHYFKYLEPIPKMVEAITKLDAECKKTGKAKVVILTGIYYVTDALLEEHIQDKIYWVQKHLPTIDIATQFMPAEGKKTTIAMLFKKSRLTEDDILVDDFNKNLVEWEDHDGLAVKFLNGTNNSKTFPGEKLPRRFTSDECLEYLLSMIDNPSETSKEEEAVIN
jgi:hypothetical protein